MPVINRRRFASPSAWAACIVVVLCEPGFAANEQNVGEAEQRMIRVGAVAYVPGAVTVFENLRRYFERNGLRVDYTLYSNYDSLVAALDQGHVDIAWNTPLAHAKYQRICGKTGQTLVMATSTADFGQN